jgi:hypothetical protein
MGQSDKCKASQPSDMQDVTERCGETVAKQEENFHVNMCPETFNL